MSEGNGDGVIKIGTQGMRKFAIGDGPAVELDVVDVDNHWREIDLQFRNPETKQVSPEKLREYYESAQRFVQGLFQDVQVNQTMAMTFLARVTEEVDKLADFFTPRLKERPSSQESSMMLECSP